MPQLIQKENLTKVKSPTCGVNIQQIRTKMGILPKWHLQKPSVNMILKYERQNF